MISSILVSALSNLAIALPPPQQTVLVQIQKCDSSSSSQYNLYRASGNGMQWWEITNGIDKFDFPYANWDDAINLCQHMDSIPHN